MAVVRRIRNRGATVTVEANAEVLFMPGGSVHSWTNRFTGRIRSATIAEAPRNKRPRWSHYGKALHTTIVSARPRFWSNGGDRQRVYGAVGSTAPHAWYVDQGTGIYNGSMPYKAKILPPWQRGEGSLYEHTWRPTGPEGKRVKPVYIKGQKGQGFFDKGLRRAFQSMRMRSYQIASDPKIGAVLNSMPTGLENFKGNTPANAAFIAQLEEWREWRDEAWSRDYLGRRIRPEREPISPSQQRRRDEAEALRRQRLAAYRASVEAAERRKREAEARVRAEQERRKRGAEKAAEERRKREERDRKLREANALRAGNAAMRAQAEAFYAKIREIDPDATFSKATLPDGVVVYRVTYTTGGETVRQQWAYGYSTG
jgi:hypothetical protein